MEIDLVYLWVDGSDPVWRAKRNAFMGTPEGTATVSCKARYTDNDELKYSLRSVEKYAPWVRKVFIVTDSQTPGWLDTENPKIKIVDHKDIMPQERLPCFNSRVIEYHLHKIPGLAERFLYANDDMFINKPVSPGTFFAKDGFPVIRLKRKPFRRLRWFWKKHIGKKPLQQYYQAIINASQAVKKRYGVYYNGTPHHNIDAYLKSDCRQIAENTFKKELEPLFVNHIRSDNDIQRIIYLYAALAEKRGYLRYIRANESLFVRPHRKHCYEKLKKYNPTLFCLNDSESVNDSDREKLKAWLSDYFPQKSAFEK
jgi:hypothetical protein